MIRPAATATLAAVLVAGCAAVPPASPPVTSAPLPQPEPRPAAPAAPLRLSLDGAATQGGMMLGTAPAGTRTLTLDGTAVAVAGDGRFVIAFDRDAPPVALLTATLSDGRSVTERVTVAPRAWRIERLDSLPRVSQPSAEFARRRPAELARIAAARATDHDVAGWRQPFLWPATGRISGLFGAQRVYRGEPGAYHSGVDVARPTGTPIVAPADGVVTLAAESDFTLEGRLLMLDHGHGLNSAFLHLSAIDVRVGQRVRRGETIGRIGATGRATGPHLHWGMKWRDSRLDPLLLAGPMPAGS